MEHTYPQLYLLDAFSDCPHLNIATSQAGQNLIWQLSEHYKAVVELNYQLQLKLSIEQAQKQALTE